MTKSIIEWLDHYKETDQYCFHGSRTAGLSILMPSQAKDQSGLPESNLIAVYASKDEYILPVVMSLITKENPDHSMHVHIKVKDGHGIVSTKTGNIAFRETGSIYVLQQGEPFEDRGSEYISLRPVNVITEISISKDTIRELVAAGKLDLHIY